MLAVRELGSAVRVSVKKGIGLGFRKERDMNL